jgi:transposase
MLMSFLMFGESQLHIDGVEVETDAIVLSISSTNSTGICPLCGVPSVRIHSNYQRHPGGLALAGYDVCLDLNVRKFCCDNDNCERTIFTEMLPSVLAPYACYTNRLADQQRHVAFALGGEAGSRLLAIMGMAVSPDTLLRLIRKTPESEVKTPRVLGVDEWAKRRGHSYGTILVDLETHEPVDLLPEKSAESFAKWLIDYPGVEIVSRDRDVEYIKGATEGAPDADQVADRWHLLKNLRDALKRLLENQRACLKAAAEKATDESQELNQDQAFNTDIEAHSASVESLAGEYTQKKQLETAQKLTRAEQEKQARQAIRQGRYEDIRQLHQQGVSIRVPFVWDYLGLPSGNI